MVCYDGTKLPREELVKHLQVLEDQIGDLSKTKVPCRQFRLPLSFESKEQADATQRYMETQRPQAPYLPDNLGFVAKNNAFSSEQLKKNLLTGTLMAVVVGFFCGNTVSLPVDPRQRMASQCIGSIWMIVLISIPVLSQDESIASLYARRNIRVGRILRLDLPSR